MAGKCPYFCLSRPIKAQFLDQNFVVRTFLSRCRDAPKSKSHNLLLQCSLMSCSFSPFLFSWIIRFRKVLVQKKDEHFDVKEVSKKQKFIEKEDIRENWKQSGRFSRILFFQGNDVSTKFLFLFQRSNTEIIFGKTSGSRYNLTTSATTKTILF